MNRELINEYLRMRSQGHTVDCELHNYEEIDILQDIHNTVKTWQHQDYVKGCMLVIALELHKSALELEKDDKEGGTGDSDNVQVIIDWATPQKTMLQQFEELADGEVFYLVAKDGSKHAKIKNQNDAFTSLTTGEWINTQWFGGDGGGVTIEKLDTEDQIAIKSILNRL